MNIVELLELAYETGTIESKACESSINYVMSKQKNNGVWRINHVYKGEGYLTFDQRGKDGEWLTYILNKVLKYKRDTSVSLFVYLVY